MKFLLDAHLPSSLVNIFNDKGYFTIHTLNLPNKNESSDNEITKYAVKKNLIIVTEDTDFYYSHITRNIPKKTLLIKTGNLSTKSLKKLVLYFFDDIVEGFKTKDIIELHQDNLIL